MKFIGSRRHKRMVRFDEVYHAVLRLLYRLWCVAVPFLYSVTDELITIRCPAHRLFSPPLIPVTSEYTFSMLYCFLQPDYRLSIVSCRVVSE
jgi:hypothetical protein